MVVEKYKNLIARMILRPRPAIWQNFIW